MTFAGNGEGRGEMAHRHISSSRAHSDKIPMDVSTSALDDYIAISGSRFIGGHKFGMVENFCFFSC